MGEDVTEGPTLTMADIGSTLLAVAEEARMGLVITALDAGLVHAVLYSEAALDILGRTREELKNANLLDFVAEEERAKAAEVVRRILAGESTPPLLETVIVQASGRRVPIDVHFVQVAQADRPLTVNILVDVSSKKELEGQLARAGRLAAMGTLAAGVAHEINNPLTFMTLRVEALRRLVEVGMPNESPRAEAIAAVADIETGVSRIASIIRGMRTLSRDDEAEETPADLWNLVASAHRLVLHEVRRHARVSIEPSSLPTVRVNTYRLEQVFANLLLNAAQAFEGPAENNLIRVRGGVLADAGVYVDIEDNGPGIPQADLANIFQPFFTSKPVGVGTGLGLSISQGIVARLGGQLSVRSVVGSGSTFRVMLPASRRIQPPPPVAREPARAGTRNGRILVVDDEPAIGHSLSSLLEDDYDVDVVTSGAAALERVFGGGSYDAILCDLMMADVTGVDVYERLAEAQRGLERKIVFMTGGAITHRARAFLSQASSTCLAKPFTFADLERALRGVMGR